MAGLLLAVFLASGVPFIVKAARKDAQIAALAPFMLFARAASLGMGLIVGLVFLVISSKVGKLEGSRLKGSDSELSNLPTFQPSNHES